MDNNGFQITPDTLRAQAHTAREAGFTQLAENFERAAELSRVPSAELLRMYEVLRPGRSTQAELLAVADALEQQHQAPITARFVREAAAVYLERGLFRKPPGV